MDACDRIRPLLGLAAEGEADPEQTLAIARHVEDCTACRILMARERRLARMVDGLQDPIEVDDAFLDRIMSEIPAAPPPRRRTRRGLKLAGLAVVLGAAGLGVGAGSGAAWTALAGGSRLTVEGGGSGLVSTAADSLARIGGSVAAFAVDGGTLHVDAPSVAGSLVVAAGFALGGGLLLVTMLAALVARLVGVGVSPGGD